MGVGAATSVVGGTMQAVAASQEQREMFRQFQRELQRQGAYRNEAMGSFNNWAPTLGAETARTEMGAGAANRMADYTRVGGQSLKQGGGNDARDQAYFDMTGANRAKLSSYNDWQNRQAISGEREGQALAKISNFAGGDAQVFPYRMYQAQHSADELAFWGQMISSIGGGASNYAQLFSGPQVSNGPGNRGELGGMGGDGIPVNYPGFDQFSYGGGYQLPAAGGAAEPGSFVIG